MFWTIVGALAFFFIGLPLICGMLMQKWFWLLMGVGLLLIGSMMLSEWQKDSSRRAYYEKTEELQRKRQAEAAREQAQEARAAEPRRKEQAEATRAAELRRAAELAKQKSTVLMKDHVARKVTTNMTLQEVRQIMGGLPDFCYVNFKLVEVYGNTYVEYYPLENNLAAGLKVKSGTPVYDYRGRTLGYVPTNAALRNIRWVTDNIRRPK